MQPGHAHDATHSYHHPPAQPIASAPHRRTSNEHSPLVAAPHRLVPSSVGPSIPPVPAGGRVYHASQQQQALVVAGPGRANPQGHGQVAVQPGGGGGGGGGGAGGPRRAHSNPDPRSWSVHQLQKKRDHFLTWLRRLSDKGALEIEMQLQQSVVMPALDRAYLPVNAAKLHAMAADMIPAPGCSAKHYLLAFELWERWAVDNEIPVFPIVGSLVALCLVDRSDVLTTPSDRYRTALILDRYREATSPGFARMGGYPREAFSLAATWTGQDWDAWASYVQQSTYELSTWRAIMDLSTMPVPPQVMTGVGTSVPQAAVMPSPYGLAQPRIAAPPQHAAAPYYSPPLSSNGLQPTPVRAIEQRPAAPAPPLQKQQQQQHLLRSSSNMSSPYPHPHSPALNPQGPSPQPRPQPSRPSSSSSATSPSITHPRLSATHSGMPYPPPAPGHAYTPPLSATGSAASQAQSPPVATRTSTNAASPRPLHPVPATAHAPAPEPAAHAPVTVRIRAADPSATVERWHAQLQDAERAALAAKQAGVQQDAIERVEEERRRSRGAAAAVGGAGAGAAGAEAQGKKMETEATAGNGGSGAKAQQPAKPSSAGAPTSTGQSTLARSTAPASAPAAPVSATAAPAPATVPSPTAAAAGPQQVPTPAASTSAPVPASTCSQTEVVTGSAAPPIAPTPRPPTLRPRLPTLPPQPPALPPPPASTSATASTSAPIASPSMPAAVPEPVLPAQSTSTPPIQPAAPPRHGKGKHQSKKLAAAQQAHALAVAAALAASAGQQPSAVPAPQQPAPPPPPPAAPQQVQPQSREDVEEAEFWAAANYAEGAILAFARAKTDAALAEQAKAAREAELGAPLRNTDEAVAAIRASPWTTGRPTVVPPRLAVVAGPSVPFGDYVPVVTVGPELRGTTYRTTVKQDPLQVLKPFPSVFPPPPAVSTLTVSPFPFPAPPSASVHLTPQPFLAYPAALSPLTKDDQNKTWSYARDIAGHVDSSLAAKRAQQQAGAAPGVVLPPLEGDARERERKEVLTATMREHLLQSLMASLPDLPEPHGARRMRKRIKKLKRRAKRAERDAAGQKPTEVLELDDSDKEAGSAAPTPMEVDPPPSEAAAAGPARERPRAELGKAKVEQAPAPSPSIAAPQTDPLPATSAPSASAPPAPTAAAVDAAAPSSAAPAPVPSPATVAAAASPSAPTFPPRPSLPNTVSAPAVPGARPRSNSQGVMRRRPSVSGPGIHPLAQLYAGVPPAMRQKIRGKANELRGDPVALAVATARLTSPALRSDKALSGSARGSPRLGGAEGASLAVASPPLVPIPLKPASGAREGAHSTAGRADESTRATTSVEGQQQPKPASALGMSIETPAMSTVAREPAATDDATRERPSLERHDSPDTAPVEKAVVVDAKGPSAAVRDKSPLAPEQPSTAPSVGASVVSTLSSFARATAGAVGAAARALLPSDDAAAGDAASSTLSSPGASRAQSPPAPLVPAAGPAVEATAPSAPIVAGAASAKTRPKSPTLCPSCGSAACPGRRLPTLCARRRSVSADSTDRGTGDGSPPAIVPAKRSAPETDKRPHPLRNVRPDWLAVSEPLKPFSDPVPHVKAFPSTRTT